MAESLEYRGFGLSEQQKDALESLQIWAELSNYTSFDLSKPLNHNNPTLVANTQSERDRIDVLLRRQQALEIKAMSAVPDLILD